MTYSVKDNAAKSFHLLVERDALVAGLVLGRHSEKHRIIQDRSVSYDFTLHQHPHVQALIRRLLKGGPRALLAADTDYTADGAALAGSVHLLLAGASRIRLAAGTPLTLAATVTVNAGGGPTELAAGLSVELRAETEFVLPDGARVVMDDALTPAPDKGTAFVLAAAQGVHSRGTFRLVPTAAVAARLPSGLDVALPATVELHLPGETPLRLAAGSPVTLAASAPRPVLYSDFFADAYGPDEDHVGRPHPVKDLDFGIRGAYALYNWELFFHVPLTVATHLAKNGHHAEAQKWFHLLFDPTDDSDGPTPARFWKVRPFQQIEVQRIEDLIVNLATGADEELRADMVASIAAWKNAPFRPHAVARYRQQAYMYRTVMGYLDNLIAWGDSLFRMDTGEAVDEALQIYVLAANILGPKPQPVPRKGRVRPQTYANLRADLREFGTVLRDMEAEIPFDLMPLPPEGGNDPSQTITLRSLGRAPYFCVPANPKLAGYWDTVADRLFKIRNSLNFQGIFRQLALFDPPYDPGALARAVAAGVDVSAVATGANQPLSIVRFDFLISRALDLAGEAKALGAAFLSATEKEDGEALANLRQRHEFEMMQRGEYVRHAQLQEAIKSREALAAGLDTAVSKYVFYERQLGVAEAEARAAIPLLDDLDRAMLEKMRFRQSEPALGPRQLDIDIASDFFADVAGVLTGGHLLSSHEVRATLLLETAQLTTDVANVLSTIGSAVSHVPDFEGNVEPFGGGASVSYGGKNLANAFATAATAANAVASRLNFEATRAMRIDGFARRELDWAYQSNLAAAEITQTLKQLRAAQLREAIAERELANHRRQMELAEEVRSFLNAEGTERRGKVSNQAFYAWLKRETRGLHAQAFQMAFDLARKAERAFRHELGDDAASYVQLGYLSGREGLLAGERLTQDLKRMEIAYREANRREYELTRHVSLLQLAPMALVQLRATGRCVLRLPEEVFDLEGPGHYFRRLRQVAVSIPSVTGPYTGIGCTLTLLKSSIRRSPVVGDDYARAGSEDPRFSDYNGRSESVVVSSGQMDAGLFDPARADERYAPFELAGAIGEWQITLPANPSAGDPVQFDYQSISDVILHLRFTAREGGDLLRRAAMGALRDRIDSGEAAGTVRLLSARHDFPTAWAAFRTGVPPQGRRAELRLDLTAAHYPYWAQGRLAGVARIDLIARPPAGVNEITVHDRAEAVDGNGQPVASRQDRLTAGTGGLVQGRFSGGAQGLPLPASPVGTLRLFPDRQDIDDLWVAVTWRGA